MKKAILGMSAALVIGTGCATDTGTGALLGGALGAGLGQAIGGNTKSTVIGGAIGAAVGGAAGNQRDAQKKNNPSLFSHRPSKGRLRAVFFVFSLKTDWSKPRNSATVSLNTPD